MFRSPHIIFFAPPFYGDFNKTTGMLSDWHTSDRTAAHVVIFPAFFDVACLTKYKGVPSHKVITKII